MRFTTESFFTDNCVRTYLQFALQPIDWARGQGVMKNPKLENCPQFVSSTRNSAFVTARKWNE